MDKSRTRQPYSHFKNSTGYLKETALEHNSAQQRSIHKSQQKSLQKGQSMSDEISSPSQDNTHGPSQARDSKTIHHSVNFVAATLEKLLRCRTQCQHEVLLNSQARQQQQTTAAGVCHAGNWHSKCTRNVNVIKVSLRLG